MQRHAMRLTERRSHIHSFLTRSALLSRYIYISCHVSLTSELSISDLGLHSFLSSVYALVFALLLNYGLSYAIFTSYGG